MTDMSTTTAPLQSIEDCLRVPHSGTASLKTLSQNLVRFRLYRYSNRPSLDGREQV